MVKLQLHWPEYAIEAAALGTFMVAAATFATLLQHPASPVTSLMLSALPLRAAMGLAMGCTAIGIIYSPWGRRSGAHMNPAVTLTFLRLGRVRGVDAAGYIAAQSAGGLLGILLATFLLADLPADAPINYVATVPGAAGAWVAVAAEAAISFGMMLTILIISNEPRAAHLTGVFAGALVAMYIVIEEPLSGMSMNPARSLGPAVLAGSLDSMWVYVAGPLAGMLAAAEAFVRLRGHVHVRCAKLVHAGSVRCIFRCGYTAPVQEAV